MLIIEKWARQITMPTQKPHIKEEPKKLDS